MRRCDEAPLRTAPDAKVPHPELTTRAVLSRPGEVGRDAAKGENRQSRWLGIAGSLRSRWLTTASSRCCSTPSRKRLLHPLENLSGDSRVQRHARGAQAPRAVDEPRNFSATPLTSAAGATASWSRFQRKSGSRSANSWPRPWLCRNCDCPEDSELAYGEI